MKLIENMHDRPRDLNQVFFHLIENAIYAIRGKANGAGSGLGLPICYRIVKAHQGRIVVESRPGEGTVFRVSLPMSPRG